MAGDALALAFGLLQFAIKLLQHKESLFFNAVVGD
jgi:hypothetical protein